MKIAYAMGAGLICSVSLVALAAPPCCEEEDFRGVGQSPEGVKIQLTEVKRVNPTDIRVTWTIKNTSGKPQVLTKGNGGSTSDKYKLVSEASLIDAVGRVRMDVAKDTRGDIIAAEHTPDILAGGIVLGPGKSMTTWAKFYAPASTSAVSVDLPGATMPWENIAISK